MLQKLLFCAVLSVFAVMSSFAQSVVIDSVAQRLEQTTDKSEKLHLLTNLVATLSEDYHDSIPYYAQQAIALARQQEDIRTLDTLFMHLGDYYYETGAFEKAKEVFQKKLTTALDSVGVGDTYLSLGATYSYLGDDSTALMYYDEAIRLYETHGTPGSESVAYSNRATIYAVRLNYFLALQGFQTAYERAALASDTFYMAVSLDNIAQVHFFQEQYDQSIRKYKTSNQLYRSMGETFMLAGNYDNMGRALLKQGKPDSALVYHHEAKKIYSDEKALLSIGFTYGYLGEAHLELENLDSAAYFLSKELEIANQIEAPLVEADALSLLAKLEGEKKNYKKGIQLARNSLHIATEIQDADLTKVNVELLTRYHAAEAQYDSAFYYQTRFMSLKDSTFREEKVADLTRLEEQFKFDKERDAYAQAAALKDAEIKQRNTFLAALGTGVVALLLLAILLYRQRQAKARANRQLSAQKEEIRLQAEELQTANERLETLGEFKEKMTGMLVHDLKNPLNSVLYATRDSEGNPKGQLAYQASLQMLTLVSNMLDVQKFDEAKMALQKQSHPLNELLDEAIGHVSLVAETKELSFVKTINPENLEAEFDRELIIRVLINLLTNAIKFSAFEGKITLEAIETAEGVKVSVKDEGEGIPAEELPHIFDRFAQVEARKGSTGLGLTFCKLAVEAHEGTIDVTSEEDEGSTFVFVLPA